MKRLKIKDALIPILLPVSAFAEECKRPGVSSCSLRSFIPEYFINESLPDLSQLFEETLKNKKAILLLDGLDEVADEGERKRMISKRRRYSPGPWKPQ